MSDYKPQTIEPKWQQHWEKTQLYRTDLAGAGKKYYAFAMFNYPSGSGIHVGHAKNFIIPDVLARRKRQQGYNVYSPVGFDSFGMPAENYALKTGTAPRVKTDDSIANYRRQYRLLGFSFDWSKEIDTSHEDYYRWTQWCFIQLHKAGLAYQKKSDQWWCQSCKTVLADEQVIDGRCWRHEGSDDPLVGKKSLKQWFFKITDYVEEILEATPSLNWTESVKKVQQNYIGRSTGLTINFGLEGCGLTGQNFTIYTTAVETILGTTFMAIAPEHKLMKQIIDQAENGQQIAEYVEMASRRTEVNRKQAKSKDGLEIVGLKAINPVTGQKIPVWVADYVLIDYGNGAIMAVPGADERDYGFAQENDLPIVYPMTNQEFVPYSEIKQNPDNYIIQAPDQLDLELDLDGKTSQVAKKMLTDWLVEQNKAKATVNYRIRDWLISRQRYWGAPIPIIHCNDCGPQLVPESDLPLRLPDIEDYKPAGDGRSPLAKVDDWVNTQCPSCGQPAKRETDTMDGYVCSSWYHLGYLAPMSKDRAWSPEIAKKWLPVDFYNGADHATAHLIYLRFFNRFFFNQGLVPEPEPVNHFYLHGKILDSGGGMMSKSKGNGVDPIGLIKDGYGADSIRVYVCFMGPLHQESNWENSGIVGCFRFLSRLFKLVEEFVRFKQDNDLDVKLDNQNFDSNDPVLALVQACLKRYNRQLDEVKLNTAVASLMDLLNKLFKVRESVSFKDNCQSWQTGLEHFVMMLSPFAPHLAADCWQRLGHQDDVDVAHWPKLDPNFQVQTVVIGIQVNGKRRAEMEINIDDPEDMVVEAALKIESVANQVKDSQVDRVIYRHGQILNIVVKK